MDDNTPHSQSIDEVIGSLHSQRERGLGAEDARQRSEQYGPNELAERPRPGFLAQLRDQGVTVHGDVQVMPGIGRFGWADDPEGNRFELWEPDAAASASDAPPAIEPAPHP